MQQHPSQDRPTASGFDARPLSQHLRVVEAASDFPNLYDSLAHQRRLTEIAAQRRRSNALWTVVFAVAYGVAAVLVAWVAMIEVAR